MSAKTYGLEWLDGQFKLGIYASEADKFDGKAIEYHSFDTEVDSALACRLLKSELADAQVAIINREQDAMTIYKQLEEARQQLALLQSHWDEIISYAKVVIAADQQHRDSYNIGRVGAFEGMLRKMEALQAPIPPVPKSEAPKPKFQKDQVVKILVGDEEGQTGYAKSIDASLDGSFSYELILRSFAQTQEYEEFELEAYTEPQSLIDYGNKFDDWQAIVAELPYAKPQEAEQPTLTTEEIDWFAKHYVDHDEFRLMPEEGYVDWLDNKAVRFFTRTDGMMLYELREAYNIPANHAAIAKRRDELKGE